MMVRRASHAHRAWLLLLFLFPFLPSQSAGQQRPPPDSLRLDSLRRAGADTTAVPDSLKPPPPLLARHTRGPSLNLAGTVWEWTADDLLREGALTLTDLLQRIPGATPYRSGLYLQPEIAAPFGFTRGRIVVLVDGYELDPLAEASVDLSRITLSEVTRVRVDRRLDVTRVELFTLEATDARTESRIEAGVGEPDVNVFRGVFMAPKFVLGPFGFAIERTDTDGLRGREPADVFAGWLKYGMVRERYGIVAEYKQTRMNRDPDSPWPGEARRADLIVRARAVPLNGLVTELFGGRSSFENDTITRSLPDSVVARFPEASTTQWGGRASLDTRFVWADAVARVRSNRALPALQIDGQAGVRFNQYAAATGSWTYQDWKDGGAASSFNLRAQAGPIAGVSAFAEIAGGKRGGPSAYFSDTIPVVLSERSATRFGIGVNRWGIRANAALLRFDTDSLPSFGLPFDSTDTRFPGGDPKGWEVAWSVPLYFQSLTAQGHVTNYLEGVLPIYQPSRVWLAALQYHGLPLASDNLELLGRLEMRFRGQVLAPVLTADSAAWQTSVLPEYRVLGAYIQIRVKEVRLFLSAENLTGEAVEEVPGRIITTPRYVYGVKWNFWN